MGRVDTDATLGAPSTDRPDGSLDGDVLRIACAAATEVAQHLQQAGFDQAWADGQDVVARIGRTRVRMVNRVRFEAGIRERVLDLLAHHLTASLINPPAKEPRS